MMPIFSPTYWLVAALIRAMVVRRSYSVRPQPGQEMYSVLVNLMRAACSMASASSVSFSCEKCGLTISSLVALRSMSSAPTVMAALSWRVDQSASSSESLTVSSAIDCAASARRAAHSAVMSTSCRATGISASGSSLSDTRMVSPMPSVSSAPMPTALFMRPSSPSPASVTPRWSG